MMDGLSFLTLSSFLMTYSRRFMIIQMLSMTIFLILFVWFLLPRVAMLIMYTPSFFSSRRRHTRYWRDWSSDVCSSDLRPVAGNRARSVRLDEAHRRRRELR